jgi:HlyD family secretion protein
MSKRIVIPLVGVIILAIAGTILSASWKKPFSDQFRFADVEKGRIVMVINSTGTVQPVKSVQIGAFVSGPIKSVNVDFNSNVKKNETLAVIDPRLYTATVERDKASVAHNLADLERVKALHDQAVANEKRALDLQATKKSYISDMEIDQFKADRRSLAAQVDLAQASVQQAQANLKTSTQNLEYTVIQSPVDGVVIDRKVDEGQTVAASFQTPTMFVVAPDLKEKIYIYAAVDEADIGLIRQAEQKENRVTFTVDAWPEKLFTGNVEQIRMNPTTTQNVVTYTVVVATKNPDLKLWPGMTANISFEIDTRENTLKIPSAALRYFPKSELVRIEDRPLLEGANSLQSEVKDQAGQTTTIKFSAEEKSLASKARNKRHVWVADGMFLRAVPIITGINSATFTELVEGELREGDKLVTGTKSLFPTGGQ